MGKFGNNEILIRYFYRLTFLLEIKMLKIRDLFHLKENIFLIFLMKTLNPMLFYLKKNYFFNEKMLSLMFLMGQMGQMD
jgi:hypothetical protein